MNEEEKEAIKEVKEIIDGDYEYPSILNEIMKTNYGNKDLIKLWYAADDESSNYEEYTDLDIAKAIVYLVNLVDKQQKEIEKLKSKKYIFNAETNEIKEIPISDDYVSKDKIIEKIKKLETSDILADYIGIQYLRELLGE